MFIGASMRDTEATRTGVAGAAFFGGALLHPAAKPTPSTIAQIRHSEIVRII
jgi:hypothetical protein